MPPFVLTVLKILFLVLLYFFVYRAIRSVVADLRGTARVPRGTGNQRATAPVPTGRRRAAPKTPRAVVVVDGRGSKLETRPLDGPLQVGRADACHIQLNDTYVSQFHARIFSRNGSWYVEDLGSTNGTYLNQRRVTSPAEVRAGDRVKIGKTILELRG